MLSTRLPVMAEVYFCLSICIYELNQADLPGGWQSSLMLLAAILFARLSFMKLTEPSGETHLSPFARPRHSFTSQLLACCWSTMLAPSYVQLASLSLRRCPNPAPVGKSVNNCFLNYTDKQIITRFWFTFIILFNSLLAFFYLIFCLFLWGLWRELIRENRKKLVQYMRLIINLIYCTSFFVYWLGQ